MVNPDIPNTAVDKMFKIKRKKRIKILKVDIEYYSPNYLKANDCSKAKFGKLL